MVLPAEPVIATLTLAGNKRKVEKVKKQLLLIMSEILDAPIDEKTFNWNSTYPDAGLDSLDVVELIIDVEKHYNITIPDSEAVPLITDEPCIKLAKYIAKRI